MPTNDLVLLTAPSRCPLDLYLLESIVDVVDFGVGTRTFIRGFECPKCGLQMAVCNICGVPEDRRAHWSWCDNFKELQDANN